MWALVAGQRLFRSADRGDTWVERSLPTSLANAEVAFADDKDGLVLSPGSPATECQTQSVTIWHTADGAGSWQQVATTGIADALCKRGLASADRTAQIGDALAEQELLGALLVGRSTNGADDGEPRLRCLGPEVGQDLRVGLGRRSGCTSEQPDAGGQPRRQLPAPAQTPRDRGVVPAPQAPLSFRRILWKRRMPPARFHLIGIHGTRRQPTERSQQAADPCLVGVAARFFGQKES